MMGAIFEWLSEGGRKKGIYTLCIGVLLTTVGILIMTKTANLPYWETNPHLGFFVAFSLYFVVLFGIGGVVLGSVWIRRNE